MPSLKLSLALFALLPAATLAAPANNGPRVQEAAGTPTGDVLPPFTFGPGSVPKATGTEDPFKVPFPFTIIKPIIPTPIPGLPIPGFPKPIEGEEKQRPDNKERAVSEAPAAISFEDFSSDSLSDDFLVLPGPGMPSLESLGVTSADLLNKTFLEEHFALTAAGQARSDTTPNHPIDVLDRRQFDRKKCALVNQKYATGRGVIACQNYLKALDKQECQVPGSKVESRVLCTAIGNRQTTWVEGLSTRGKVVSTMCSNLAAPISRIHWNCSLCMATLFDCATKGADVVDDNTDMLVTVHGTWKPEAV